ncbi:MAG: type II toxin-antitoxin system RelE/ParE family toxin [Candidatus Delongbacteria bacterium]|nr:type II toxin-antitoxin system RelE/ParE family toxin [Candidatus Delongbacteria bacterium]
MIISFKDIETEKIWNQEFSKKYPKSIQRTALRKLLILNAAQNINDLRIPPGNKLEALKGNKKGQHSIRINDQRRICFLWKQNNAHQVEIIDYH